MAKRDDINPPMRPEGRAKSEGNRLLAAVPSHELEQIEPHLEHVTLDFGRVLHEPDRRIDHAYFPLSGVISAVKGFANGDVVEVATIGNEGVAGNSIALGVPVAGNRVLVQVAGEGVRIETNEFIRLLDRCPELRGILLRYSQALFHQVAQTAACNRAHTVDERCARWLLMTHDRVGSDSFVLTQEFLAQMLGVHRPTVSVAAGMLQKAGLINYVRGHVTVLNRKALEEASCECYRLIQEQYAVALSH